MSFISPDGKLKGKFTHPNLERMKKMENKNRERETELATARAEEQSPDGVVDLVIYPEFFWWQQEHKNLVKSEPLPTNTDCYCPRCHSNKIIISYPYIQCRHCGYNEPLIDFPISQNIHVALLTPEVTKPLSLFTKEIE